MFDEATVNKCHEYVSSVARRMGSFDFDPNSLVWHYTSGSALVAIVQGQRLYATQVSCLNDSMEVRYSAGLFREALSREALQYAPDSSEGRFLSLALEFFAEEPSFPNNLQIPYVVTCFTALRDDLSQWRAYGGGENGFAIGFRISDLYGLPNTMIGRVCYYNPEQHGSLTQEMAQVTVSFFQDGAKGLAGDELKSWTVNFLRFWDQCITQVAPLIKDPGFKSEDEIRLIRGFQQGDLEQLVFKQKSNMLARHLPVQPGKRDGLDYKLPISEVMVGPCRFQSVSRASTQALLAANGYMYCPVSLSATPYQNA